MRGLSWLKRPSPFLVFAFVAFCAVPLPLQLLATTFEIVTPINLRPMTATGVLPGDVLIVLMFTAVAAAVAAAAAASMFVEGGGRNSQHCSIARRELGLITVQILGEFCWQKRYKLK